MKREIIFRSAFFSNKDNKFSYFSYWGFINHKGEYDDRCFTSPGTSSHDYIKTNDQYTGLKDKNGKEIYEGDIVSHSLDDYTTFPSEIKFIDGMFCFFNKPIGHTELIESLLYCEVIGNIYENPELL